MSGLDPSGPSQPSQQTGLNQAGNAASKTNEEQKTSQSHSDTASHPIDHRETHDVPSQHGEAANSWGLGRGDTGPLKEKPIPESDAENYAKGDSNLEGEQMRMTGEGDVARAVRQGGGGGHAEEESLTQDIDDQAKEHADELHRRGERTGKEIEEEEGEDWTGKKADVAKALGAEEEGRPAVVLAAEE